MSVEACLWTAYLPRWAGARRAVREMTLPRLAESWAVCAASEYAIRAAWGLVVK